MALTNAEKVRAFRAREKHKKADEARLPQAHTFDDVFVAPFFEYIADNGNTSDFDQAFDMMGIEAPEFADDSGPKSKFGMFEADPELKNSVFPDSTRSIDRAELMVGCLLDAALTLAGIIRSYKKREIDCRIEQITASDLADSQTKKEAIARIVALTKMREQLEKGVRWELPQWRVENLTKAR